MADVRGEVNSKWVARRCYACYGTGDLPEDRCYWRRSNWVRCYACKGQGQVYWLEPEQENVSEETLDVPIGSVWRHRFANQPDTQMTVVGYENDDILYIDSENIWRMTRPSADDVEKWEYSSDDRVWKMSRSTWKAVAIPYKSK